MVLYESLFFLFPIYQTQGSALLTQYHNNAFGCASLLLELTLSYDISIRAITWIHFAGISVKERLQLLWSECKQIPMFYYTKWERYLQLLHWRSSYQTFFFLKLDFPISRTKLPTVNVLFMDSLNITI